MPPVPVCPSPRPQESFATAKEQTENTMPAAEEVITGPGAGSAVAVGMDPAPPVARLTWRLPSTAGAMRRVGGPSLNV